MKEFAHILMSFQTVVLVVAVFMLMTIARIVSARVRKLTSNKFVLGFLKYAGTMWLPLWPIVLGMVLVFTPTMPIHPELAAVEGMPKALFGAFVGMLNAGLVTALTHVLDKLGIKVNIPGLLSTKSKDDAHSSAKDTA